MQSDFRSVLHETVTDLAAQQWIERDGWMRVESPSRTESTFELACQRELSGSEWEHPTGAGHVRLSVDREFGVIFATYSEDTAATLKRQADFAMGVLSLDEIMERAQSPEPLLCLDGLMRLGFLAPPQSRSVYLAWASGLFHPNPQIQLAALHAVGVLTAVIEVPMTATLAAAVDEVLEYSDGEVRTAATNLGITFDRLLGIEQVADGHAQTD